MMSQMQKQFSRWVKYERDPTELVFIAKVIVKDEQEATEAEQMNEQIQQLRDQLVQSEERAIEREERIMQAVKDSKSAA